MVWIIVVFSINSQHFIVSDGKRVAQTEIVYDHILRQLYMRSKWWVVILALIAHFLSF